MGRSLNAEIASRLEDSFTSSTATLPFAVQEAVAGEVEARGGTPLDALTRLVLAGQASGGTVFYATINPQTTFKQLRDMLEAGKTTIPPSATVVTERQRLSKT